MNLIIRTLEDELARILNESTLPVEIKRLIVKDIYNQLEMSATNVIAKETADELHKD